MFKINGESELQVGKASQSGITCFISGNEFWNSSSTMCTFAVNFIEDTDLLILTASSTHCWNHLTKF